MKKHKQTVVFLILFLLLALPPMVYFYVTRGFNTFIKLDVIGEEIPEFNFINQDNEVIVRDSLQGNIYVANFFFTSCPQICPSMTANMSYLQQKLSIYPDIKFISYTVDPTTDTPEQMLSYINNLRANNVKIDLSNWDFVTGDVDALNNIAQSYLVSAGYKDLNSPGGFVHSPNFVLVDKEGKIRTGVDKKNNIVGAYDGSNPAKMRDLIDDIKVLMAEYNRPVKDDKE